MDIIVIKREDGSLASTQVHVQFGLLTVATLTKNVDVYVNKKKAPLTMRLSVNGRVLVVHDSSNIQIESIY